MNSRKQLLQKLLTLSNNFEKLLSSMDRKQKPCCQECAENKPCAGEAEEKSDQKVQRLEGESEQDCVSRGIAKLISEGKDPEQAAAIAYSMCGEKKLTG